MTPERHREILARLYGPDSPRSFLYVAPPGPNVPPSDADTITYAEAVELAKLRHTSGRVWYGQREIVNSTAIGREAWKEMAVAS